MKFLSGTGTRQIAAWSPDDQREVLDITIQAIEPWVEADDVTLVSGFAQGFDTVIILAAMELDLPYIGCIPNRGYGRYYWGKNSVTGKDAYTQYLEYLDGAVEIEYTNEFYGTNSLYYQGKHMNFWRNQRLVDRGDGLLAWAESKKEADGGTKDCIQRAVNAEMHIDFLKAEQRGMF